jgi:4-diphosphocytidyl-2-C-methyl-D-erythritol kinase
LTLALPARAKLNLDLEVLGRRDDSFHEVRTRLQAVDLHDLLLIEAADETTITMSGLEVKSAAVNSVLMAHTAVEVAAGRRLPTRFHLHKRVPPGAGLGGASSDAASTLRGLAAMHRLSFDLAPIAETLGTDVAFFLAGGATLAEGRGERLTPAHVEPAWFAIAWPGFEVSTATVYRAWDEVKSEPGDVNQLTQAAAHINPRVKEFAERLGPGWQMTGSGSAFFRRYSDVGEARQVTAAMDGWTAVTRTVGRWA